MPSLLSIPATPLRLFLNPSFIWSLPSNNASPLTTNKLLVFTLEQNILALLLLEIAIISPILFTF